MFRSITKALEGIRLELSGLRKGLTQLAEHQQADFPMDALLDRLASLEGRIEVVAGEAEASIVKADSIKAAAAAHEQRARGHLGRAEKLAEIVQSSPTGEEEDSFESAARAFAQQLPEGNDEGVEGLPPVPVGVGEAVSDVARAKAAKRGMM